MLAKISIGRRVKTDEKVYYVDKGTYGVVIFCASTRYGKTELSKILYVKLSKFRPVIILDFAGEHRFSKYPNFLSKDDIACIPGLYKVNNIVFKISDFSSTADWFSLRFPEFASKLLANLAYNFRDIHEDNYEKFLDLCRDLPSSGEELARFTRKYNRTDMYKIASATKDSIIGRIMLLDNFFYDEEKILSGEQVYIASWGELLKKKKYLHINLELSKSAYDVMKGRAYVGKILEKLATKDFYYLKMLNPLIVVEEADLLAPKLTADVVEYSSLYWLRRYVIKLQKYHVSLFFITQDLDLLDKTIVNNYHDQFLGNMENVPPELTKIISKLRWNDLINYREFLWRHKGRWENIIFYPEEIPCLSQR